MSNDGGSAAIAQLVSLQPIKLDGTKLKLNFWDLSGDDAYLEVRNEFYKDAQCVRAPHFEPSELTSNLPLGADHSCV